MKKIFVLFLVLGCFFTLLGLNRDENDEPTFVGVNKCKICHKSEKSGNQYGKWKDGKHSQAYQDVVGKDAKCLKCHSPYEEDKPELKEDGVGCEACHGAGSKYKSYSIMKDRDAAVKNGLRVLDTDEQKIALCLQCHGSNPYHEITEFNLKEFWEKIKHPKPEE